MKKYRVAVIGCGVISSSHLVPLSEQENTEIAAVCDIKKERADTKATEFGCKAYYDYKEMIDSEQLDSVHICLPHYLHSTVSIYALQHGLDVLCEKPVDISFEKALDMKAAADKSGKRLGIIFQNRYNEGTVFAKELLDSGKLGKVLGCSAELLWNRDQAYYDQDEWRGKWDTEGGGVLINQSIHTLDLMRYLMPSEVRSVTASVAHRGTTNVEVEDTAEGYVVFKDGTHGVFYFTNNYTSFLPVRVSISCESGDIYITGASATAKLKDGTLLNSDVSTQKAIGKKCYGTGHFKQIADFYGDNPEAAASFMLDEALKTQKLLEDIYTFAGRKKFN